MIIDSHCHLDYEPIFSNLDDIINRAGKNGVNLMLSICTEEKKFSKILEISNRYRQVFLTYGIHPHESKNHKNINKSSILKSLKESKKIIGIGETGLDFYYNHSNKDLQISLFQEHIEAAQISGLPLIIHSRNAEKETLEILRDNIKFKEFKFLIHCFTGSYPFSKDIINLGGFISASGVVTFKKSKDLAKTLTSVPNNRILIETDSPYLSPEPNRGKPNEPSYIVHTLKFLSNLKNLDAQEFAKITSNNFFNLFGKII
tara:strand:+ start:519 stop:1295 length:777 start_codon:yes stop_codon:yes gene_type:complete